MFTISDISIFINIFLLLISLFFGLIFNKSTTNIIEDIDKSTVNIIDDINKIYSNNSAFVTTQDIETEYTLTYGEITYDAIVNIRNKFPTKKTFIDLGCGNGRSLVYALISGFEYAKGVEFVKKRVEKGELAISDIKKKNIHINFNNIYIKQDDLFTLDNSFFPENSIIFISNLLYSKDLNNKITNFFNDKIFVKDIILIVSKKLNIIPNNFILEDILLKTPMSWDKHSESYVYSKN